MATDTIWTQKSGCGVSNVLPEAISPADGQRVMVSPKTVDFLFDTHNVLLSKWDLKDVGNRRLYFSKHILHSADGFFCAEVLAADCGLFGIMLQKGRVI